MLTLRVLRVPIQSSFQHKFFFWKSDKNWSNYGQKLSLGVLIDLLAMGLAVQYWKLFKDLDIDRAQRKVKGHMNLFNRRSITIWVIFYTMLFLMKRLFFQCFMIEMPLNLEKKFHLWNEKHIPDNKNNWSHRCFVYPMGSTPCCWFFRSPSPLLLTPRKYKTILKKCKYINYIGIT